MRFQTAVDSSAAERVFRAVRNSTTGTSTVTLAVGTPLILETNTGSADGVFVKQAVTATAIINNLYVGNVHVALPADTVGIAQCYGYDDDAVVLTGGADAGALLVPNIASFQTVGASTAGNPGLQGGGDRAVVVLVAPSGAATAATKVFINAL